MTDELSGLIKESKEPEEKLLDPGQIQTVILAPTFIRYEENYEVLKAIDGKPFLKKLNTLLAKTTVVRQIGLVIIWLTFLNQEESWCKEGHRVGSFKAEDLRCSIDVNGNKFYTFGGYLSSSSMVFTFISWLAMILVMATDLMSLFIKTNLKTKIRCISIAVSFVAVVLWDILYMSGATYYNWDSYFKIIFVVLTSSALRNALKNLGQTIYLSYQAIVLYLMLLVVFTCIVYVAVTGPTRIGYHDTSKDSNYFYHNLTTWPKILFTMYMSQTTTNFPDQMVFRWKGNEVLMGFIFCFYTFLMAFIIMNVLVAIFYSNYKSLFSKEISNLQNQGRLRSIVDYAVDKTGSLNMNLVNKLLEKLYVKRDEKGFDELIEGEELKRQTKRLKRAIKARDARNKEQEDQDGAGTRERSEWIPHSKRLAGYNKKHNETYKAIRKNIAYKWFFIILNLYIAFKPISIIASKKSSYFSFNDYAMIDLACIIALIDPLFVFVFRGGRFLKRPLFAVEFVTTIIIYCLGFSISNFGIDIQHAGNFERYIPIPFTIYAFCCLARILRMFSEVLLHMPQISAVLNAISNMRPILFAMVSMITVVFLFFAQLGIHLFGGKINSTTPFRYAEVSGGSIGGNYEIMNFNDFPNALMMLWALLVNNCWPTLTISAVSMDNKPYQIIYFVAFIIVICVVILNIVVGSVIDVILAYLGATKGPEEESDLDDLLADIEGVDKDGAFKFINRGD